MLDVCILFVYQMVCVHPLCILNGGSLHCVQPMVNKTSSTVLLHSVYLTSVGGESSHFPVHVFSPVRQLASAA